jgi:magnesium chelatase family protein
MLAKIYSATTLGLDAVPITVEVDVSARGLPSLSIVGLPDKAVQESKERVRAALINSGTEFPARKITINLAPADIPKVGPAYDLPIAVGLLIAKGDIAPITEKSLFFGELSLDGTLRSTRSVLPITLMASQKHFHNIFIPEGNAIEASIISGVNIYAISNIKSLVSHLNNINVISPQTPIALSSLLQKHMTTIDMADIHGQEQVKRAMQIAAAGGHNIHLSGLPGSGKTMLSRAFSGILPQLTEAESLEITKIYSITGLLPSDQSLITTRPFRSPHHTTSKVGLIGGGTNPTPGEISLAHRGVLFLDEFPEFPRSVIESLRQPMEDGQVQISRASTSVTYPCRFTLVAASNPCPCGHLGDAKHACTCSGTQINNYQKKISGPMLDRIDLHVHVPAVEVSKLTASNLTAETSSVIQSRVQHARDIQTKRFIKSNITTNAEMSTKDLKIFCPLDPSSQSFLTEATAKLGLTARSYFKTIKVARTIADLAGEGSITTKHLAESLQYRPKINNYS